MATDRTKPIHYELVEMSKGADLLVLHANGMQCTCPYSPAMPMPNEKGQMTGVGRPACNTTCPLAKVKTESKDGEDYVTYFDIACGSEIIRREVTIRTLGVIEKPYHGMRGIV